MTEVVANELVLLGGPSGGGGGFQKRGAAAGNDFDQRSPEPEPAHADTGITDEDIPF